MPEVMSGQSRATCFAWHRRQMCLYLHFEKEHSPLFHRLQTSSGMLDGQLAAGVMRVAVVVGLEVGCGSAMAISQMSGSRLCHSRVGFVAAAWRKTWSYLYQACPFKRRASPVTIDIYVARLKARWGCAWTAMAMYVVKAAVQSRGEEIVYLCFFLSPSLSLASSVYLARSNWTSRSASGRRSASSM